MSDKYKGIYRNQSFRLKNWDYGSEGFYFITICTQNRVPFFGEIISDATFVGEMDKMVLSEIGELAQKYWIEIENQFSYIQLHEFIIMPDHLHGILEIKSENLCRLAINRQPTKIEIEQDQIVKTQVKGGFTGDKNPMLHDNISRVIRWYKGRCSFEIRKRAPNFNWQPLFYDRIIRNQFEYKRIEQYIIDNPKKWNKGFGGKHENSKLRV